MKKDALKSYEKSSLEYFANSNSLHKLGLKSKDLEDAATNTILDILKLKNKEIIYTSGSAENFTLLLTNIKKNKNVVTDNKELYEIGKEMNIDIKYGNVKGLIDNNTQLVSVINDIDIPSFKGLLHINLKEKNNINLNKYNYISIEEIPFFGCLIKDKNIVLKPLINGGKSTTIYRSGTSPTNLIVALAKFIKIKYK